MFFAHHTPFNAPILFSACVTLDPTRLPKIMIHWKPEGRKKRGRPRRTWKDGIYTGMSERDLRMGEWNNRRQWNMKVGRRRQTFLNFARYIYNVIGNKTNVIRGNKILIINNYSLMSFLLLLKISLWKCSSGICFWSALFAERNLHVKQYY